MPSPRRAVLACPEYRDGRRCRYLASGDLGLTVHLIDAHRMAAPQAARRASVVARLTLGLDAEDLNAERVEPDTP